MDEGSVGADGNLGELPEIWQTGFKEFRDRRWARTDQCATCRQWRNCLGGGMHNWHDGHLLECHYSKLGEQ